MARRSERPTRFRWHVVPKWEPVLIDEGRLPLDRWRRQGLLTVVKDVPHRFVCRVELPQGAVFVKQYRRRGVWARLRQRLAPTPARREWRNLRRLAQLGVPTAEPLGWIEQLHGRWITDSILVTRAIESSFSLEEFLRQLLVDIGDPSRARLLRRVVVEFARLLAGLHRAGGVDPDLHLGNVLVVFDQPPPAGNPAGPLHREGQSGASSPSNVPLDYPPGQLCHQWLSAECSPRVVLIDVRKMRFARCGPVSWRQARRNLVALHASTFDRLPLRCRLLFWREYARGAQGVVPEDRRSALYRLWHDTVRDARRLALYYDRRSGRDDGRIVTVSPEQIALIFSGPFLAPAGSGRTGAQEQQLAELLASHRCTAISAGEETGEIIAEQHCAAGNTLQWTCVELGTSAREQDQLLDGLRRRWLAALALYRRRIACPRPVLFALTRSGRPNKARRWHMAHMALEFPPNASSLERFIDNGTGCHEHHWQAAVGGCATALGAFWGRLTLWAVGLTRVSLDDFLVQWHGRPGPTGSVLAVYLAGFDGVQIARQPEQRVEIDQLAQLAIAARSHPSVSRTICLRFLKSYLRTTRQSARHWKHWWRRIARRIER